MPREHDKTHRPRTAFTLIELLVVIAIVALLMSLLFPHMNSVIGAARSAACLGTQRQLAAATFMHIDDKGGRYPAGVLYHPSIRSVATYLADPERYLHPPTPEALIECGAAWTGTDSGYNWAEQIYDYLAGPGAMARMNAAGGPRSDEARAVRFFYCAADPTARTGEGNFDRHPFSNANSYSINQQRDRYGNWDGIAYPYGENTRRFPLPGGAPSGPGHQSMYTFAHWVPLPSQTFLYVDRAPRGVRYDFRHSNGAIVRIPWWSSHFEIEPGRGYHGGRYSWALCDGSARMMHVEETWGAAGGIYDARGMWTKRVDD